MRVGAAPNLAAVRVVVAEDSLIAREGLLALLASESDVEVVATAESYDELLEATERESPEVVVTDIRMPPTRSDEGIRAAEVIRDRSPNTAVLVLSQYAEVDYALSLLEGGSTGRGYLLKERLSHPEQLIAALREVAAGGSVVDPTIVELLVHTRGRQHRSPLDALTERELEVLGEMAKGRSNAGIAAALYLSAGGVEKHINSVFSKLGLGPEPEVHRRVRAVLLFLSEREGD